MAVYLYRGRNADGNVAQGTLEGEDSSAIAELLIRQGITPIEIHESGKVASVALSGAGWWQKLQERNVGTVELMLLSRQMYTLLKAGVPIMRALAGLQESADNPVLARTLQSLRENLDSGRELSNAMRQHPKIFSPFYISMVQVGEMTGTLDQVFLQLYEHLEFEKDMNERIRAAVRYPIFVIVAMGVALVIVNLFVIPAFAKVFAGFHAELPLMTRILLGFSNFMVNYWYVLLLLLVVSVFAFVRYINTRAGRLKWDQYKLELPIAGKIIMKSTLARFSRSLALAFKSGIPVLQGLNVVAMVVDNAYVAQKVDQMREGVERGESILRTAILTKVFNPVVLQMIAVGEETGDMDGLMFEVAGMYEREVDYEIKTLAQQIEPILIVGLGVLVLILALGVFLPIWDLGRAALHR